MIPEINLKITTKKVPDDNYYSLNDIEKMFGSRIKSAVIEEHTKNGNVYQALIAKKMSKICRKWKFWNRDIRKAWKKYRGMIIVPYIIYNESPIVISHNSDHEDEINEILTKEIKSKYKVMGEYEKND